MLKEKRILLGVTGGIAVYKAVDLTSKLVQQGADVKVVMTENATKFVTPLTFQALSRNDVHIDTFDEKDPQRIAHIDLADWADILILAPATANFLGKVANGIADDMLSTILMATRASVYIAPAMNVHMYDHPAVIENMKTLDSIGYHFIEPGAGYLACGYVGKGRLEEPISIIKTIKKHLARSKSLEGKKILITAGPTRETIDPVRFLSNRSSGKMGFALAEQAANMGANVVLVTGPVQLETHHKQINRIDVTTAEEMYKAVFEHYDKIDIVIKAAAVSDYRPKKVHTDKMKKQPGELNLEMERTKDILQSLGEQKKDQFLVGFAAETRDILAYGEEKLKQKNLDAIIINNVKTSGAGFEGDTNIATYLNPKGEKHELPLQSKDELATNILKLIVQDMKGDKQ